MMRLRGRKDATTITNISTIADLVASRPYFQVGGIVHRYIGRQTQVMEDDREIGAYMFRRTVPSLYLTPDDVRWMFGAWRDRIIICTGMRGPPQTLINALLDSGAKAVISSAEQPEMQIKGFNGSGEMNYLETEKFEIGEDEGDEEYEATEPTSSVSDWEDGEAERGVEHSAGFWDDEEEELSQFMCRLYDALFREGAKVDAALQLALASNRKLRYSCHLPGLP